jgi:putative RecB family exonuclease
MATVTVAAGVSEPMIALAEPGTGRTIEELTESVSASRLTTWQQCRLKFYFRYVAGLVKPPSPALHIGTTVHTVLQQWNLARWRRAPLDPDAVVAVFNDAWTHVRGDQEIAWEDEAASKANALATLQTYLRETPIPVDEKPEAVEVTVELDLPDGMPTLVGVIDLVRAGGVIVDFKTTGRTPDPEMVTHTTELQTTGYAMLYREATGKTETGIELHHLVKTKTPKLVVTQLGPATDAQEQRLLRVVESYVSGLEREDFTPSPGMQCGGCEYFNECRLWH